MTKALVAAPFIPISRFPHSHRGSQGVIYADMLRQTGRDVTCNMSLDLYHSDFNKFDELWVYHGNDWNGHLNIYGGLQNFPYADNFRNFTKFKGKVYSIAIPFPDYHGLLTHKRRLMEEKGKSHLIQPEWLDADWDNLLRMQREAETVPYPYQTSRLVIGDSHATSLYRPGWTVNSIPFKTLHGALSIGLENLLPETYCRWDSVTDLDLYFGNIDVRHHLMRQEDPVGATEQLALEYAMAAVELNVDHGVEKVSIYELLPIENESRVIPKTGWYEDRPYWGTWEERNRIRLLFRDTLEKCLQNTNVRLVRWTDGLLNDRGELDFKRMERAKSVHLSRDAYPYWKGEEWNGPSDGLV